MDEDPIEILIQKQTSIALAKLNAFKINKIHLKRPVFFVSGWCDEACTWWVGPKEDVSGIAQWIKQIVDNPHQASFINFDSITSQCQSFLNFGNILKNNIWTAIGRNQEFDLVGYSMGGLVVRAALTQGDPLMNCQNCVTADAPHQGDDFGGIIKALETYAPHLMAEKDNMPLYHQQQVENMDPNSQPMQLINNLENKKLFLERVNKFYQFKGTRDYVVMDSCFMDLTNLGELYIQKVTSIPVEGCGHVGANGVTIDIRTILATVYMLLGIDFPLASNHGNFPDGNDTPPNDDEIFIG